MPPSAVPVPAAATKAPRVAVAPSPAATREVSADTPEPTQPPATAAPTPAPTPEPTAVSATPAAAAGYDDRAASVVHRYLDALIRGDEKTAYSALGGSGGTLSEEAFLDPTARVVSTKVTRVDASNASVGCEIVSAKGHYYATYHVTAATSGPYISEHDFIKV
jgi:hypothetical protein